VPTNGDTNEVNVLGHTHVADRLRPDDVAHALGAVLPDLATIAGVRLQTPLRTPAHTALAEGIACHHAVDATFHSLARFRTGAAALRHDLLAAGLPTGPARAVAHVGYELLLDGALVGSAAEDAYRRAVAIAATATDVISPVHRAQWRAFVHRIAMDGHRTVRYDDVDWVAGRLFGLLATRPRLRLERRDVASVALVLGRHAPAIRASAGDILDSTYASRRVG
jgi:hypothetical protein